MTETINAPIERVFDAFTDLAHAKDRISGIKSLEILEGSEKMAVGTKWSETREMMGKDSTEVMWVVELTPNASYRVDAESHGTKYRSDFSFEELADGVKVSWTFEGKPQTIGSKIMGLIGVLFLGPLKKLMKQDLIDLKQYCESEA